MIAIQTLVRKEVHRFMRIWSQTILPSMITTALYYVIFGNLIGQRIGEFDGHPYINFIVPGLIMMAVITNAYANTVSSFYFHKFQKNIDEMLISPMKNYEILVGFVAGGVARGLAVGAGVTLVSLIFTQVRVFSWPLTILVIFLSTTLFSLMGLMNGIYARKFDDVSIVPTFILTPLTFLGGVFYSITILPEFWQKLSLLNPILYLVNSFRYGILGTSDINIFYALLATVVFIIILFILNLRLLNKGIGIKN